jgi:hypothetical protein
MKDRNRTKELALLMGMGVIGLVGAGIVVACGGAEPGSTSDAGTTPDVVSATDGSALGQCTSDPATASHTAAVVAAANALVAKLSANQQTTIQLDGTLANAEQWSNLPTSMIPRNGVKLADMSADAQAAAVALVQLAAGTTGGTLFSELRAADQWLVTNGNAPSNSYGDGLYYVAFVGTPSTTSPWTLQIAGHHLAYVFTYGAKCTSATPLFDGVEPTSWNDGTAHAPLEAQRAAVVALLATLSSTADAKLSGTYNDIVAGPTNQNGKGDTRYGSIAYPTGTTGRGVLGSALSASQRALLKTAIEAWVKNVADPIANVLLGEYESDAALDQTYVAYSGSADLSTKASYFRVDGPRVWIELTVQGGIVYQNVHYHTIWRDKAADYGAQFVQ